MKQKWIENEFIYDGSQLRPLFAFEKYGVEGESIISWVGACNVANKHMIDGEDLFAGDSIRSAKMLHFIIEVFDQPLFGMVALQRLFASVVKDQLEFDGEEDFVRDGDDLFLEKAKLSISIASRDAVSSMIHFAVNVSTDDTPVETVSLEDIGINPKVFSEKVMESFSDEYLGIVRATKKVYSL
ncbi:MAG: DUF366 family protein [Bdellovibrionales bacterium]